MGILERKTNCCYNQVNTEWDHSSFLHFETAKRKQPNWQDNEESDKQVESKSHKLYYRLIT